MTGYEIVHNLLDVELAEAYNSGPMLLKLENQLFTNSQMTRQQVIQTMMESILSETSKRWEKSLQQPSEAQQMKVGDKVHLKLSRVSCAVGDSDAMQLGIVGSNNEQLKIEMSLIDFARILTCEPNIACKVVRCRLPKEKT